ncbi:hypothetical protein DENIS_2504 [Desulfonema ishimotonii]|uniref:SsuA/THI5-like domain-containing protein n=1 Tax=Desulfonema ishimotonii TaxID=45657 RepID=A0A401FX16_9BACT|nr:ABC transporter substrate-binding protein [Desulfonema ishimotonii]GBC61542.1 hypothetical protein DENIS_2504 [Desulfonema ishimotonii]
MKFRIFTALMVFFCTLHGNTVLARTYTIGMTSWAGWSPASVAAARGFWKQEGIDVRVVTTPSPRTTFSLFKNRLIDISFEMIGSQIGFYMDGLPVVILAETNWSHGGDKIIMKTGSDQDLLIKNPIGVYLNAPSITFFLDRYLSSQGLKLSDTRVVEMAPKKLTKFFISGRFSAIVSYAPEAMRALSGGHSRVVATSATCEGCIPEGMMALEDVLAKMPQEDLVRIFRGWIRAARWCRQPENWGRYSEILSRRTFEGDSPHSDEDLREMVSSVRIHDARTLSERNRDGGGLYAWLVRLRDFLKRNQMLKKDFDPRRVFDNRAILEALRTGVTDTPEGLKQ